MNEQEKDLLSEEPACGSPEEENQQAETEQIEHVGESIHYHLSRQQGWAALMYVDRKHNLWKRIFFSVVLFGLGLYFILTACLNQVSNTTQQLIIGLVCLGFGLFYWLIFWIENSRRAKAIGEAQQEFTMTFYEDGIGVGQKPEEEFLSFAEKKLYVEEQRDCFLISWADEKLFCLEKFRMSPAEISMVQSRLQKGLPQKSYRIKKGAELEPRPMSKEKTEIAR